MTIGKHVLITVMCLLLVTAAYDVLADETGIKIAWGESRSGLQAGMAIEDTKDAYHPGDSVSYMLFVRNTTDDPINLEFTESEPWIPEVSGQAGKAVPVLTPYRDRGGRILNPTLKPEAMSMVSKGTLVMKPLSWEGAISKNTLFADSGRHSVRCTLEFRSYFHRPAGENPWSGEITTGEVDFQVEIGNDVPKSRPVKGVSKAGMRTVLCLLGDNTKHRLSVRYIDGDSDRWQQEFLDWSARCAALEDSGILYLEHLATALLDDTYRAAACEALGETKKPRTVTCLVRCLADPCPAVRMKAVRSIGSFGSIDAVPEMQKLLTDKDDDVRSSTAYALGHIGSRRATQALLKAFRDEENLQVRSAVLQAIGWIADPAALPVLKKELKGPTELPEISLENCIRSIEDPDFWGLGIKAGVSEAQLYRILSGKLGMPSRAVSSLEAESAIFDHPGEWSSAFSHDGDTVYYNAEDKVFYIAQRKREPEATFYFGPFEGNPHDIVRPARKELELERNPE